MTVGGAAILTYHSLDDDGSVLSTPPRMFAEQLAWLAEAGIAVVPLSELDRQLDPVAPRPPSVAIAFDDGYLSVYEHGLPVLRRHGFPATVFVVTDYCGKTSAWPSQPPHVRRRPLLDWTHLREMARAGVTVGSHTRTHPDLRRLSTHGIADELAGSKHAIEDALGQPVDAFAYPYGAHDGRVREAARAHFPIACSTRLGYVERSSDRLALPRLDVYYLRCRHLFGRLLTRELALYLGLRQMGRDLRALSRGT